MKNIHFELATTSHEDSSTQTIEMSDNLGDLLQRAIDDRRLFIDLWINGMPYHDIVNNGKVSQNLFGSGKKSLDIKLMNDANISQELREEIMEHLAEIIYRIKN